MITDVSTNIFLIINAKKKKGLNYFKFQHFVIYIFYLLGIIQMGKQQTSFTCLLSLCLILL